MSRLAAPFCLLLSLPAGAGEGATPAPASRTLEQLVTQGLALGRRKVIKAPMSENLGFSSEPASKLLKYKKEAAPDGQEHLFQVLYEDRSGKPSPTGLVLCRTKVIKAAGTVRVEGVCFRASLSGELEGAVFAAGVVGEVKQKRRSSSDKRARAEFQDELAFYLKKTATLPFSP